MARNLVAWLIGLTVTGAPVASDQPAIRSESDLPPSHFALAGPPSTAMWDDAFVTHVVPALRAEAERVRARYRVADPAISSSLRSGLAAIAVLQHRPRDAEALVAEARSAATKPQDRVLGLLPVDVAAAFSAGSGPNCAAGAARITALLRSSDAAVTRDAALGRLSQFETTSAASLAGLTQAEIDPGAGRRSGVTLLEGLTLANWRVQAIMLPPCRPAYAAAIRAWLAEPRNQPVDVWTRRQPSPDLLAGAKPVVVAVWDGGIDPSLFPGQLAVDPAEPLDVRDNDGNGVTDDWNGPTYDDHVRPSPASLVAPSRELAGQRAFQMALRKGAMDLGQGEETPEAALFGQRSREGRQAEQALDALLWDEVGYRSHGTAVASEIADGAPFVRLYNVSALPFRRDPRPVPLDEGQIDRWVAGLERLAPRLRDAGVRIVNVSSGITADEIAGSLLAARLAPD